MSTQTNRSLPANSSLPDSPDLRHLKNQAKDLLKAGGASSLTDAQFKLAREYGFASWPKLKRHVKSLAEVGQLKDAIDRNDFDRVKSLMTSNSALHGAPLGYGKNGPLTWAAECRGVPCSPERLAIAKWMIENGSDVHQGGDGPLMRAALNDNRIPMIELLFEHGADVNGKWNGNYPIICAPCETLQPRVLRWLIKHGAVMHVISTDYGSCPAMLVATYSRNSTGKHECLEVFADAGFELPDTAPMAIHRGRIDLLEACWQRDSTVLQRHYSEREIFPEELGMKPGYGLHGAPLDGTALLHMAVEYQELEIAEWLLKHGANANARASVDAEGFGGHAPLFHATVTLGPKHDSLVKVLLQYGANPKLRATFRKKLVDSSNDEMREFHDVTAIEFARQFQEPAWANEPAISAVESWEPH
jgi:ankyrin repeat protein